MALFGADIHTMDDLYLHTLQDIYYAEKQIEKELPKMAKKAEDEAAMDEVGALGRLAPQDRIADRDGRGGLLAERVLRAARRVRRGRGHVLVLLDEL